ncbi:MAG: hypothetical protein IJC17_02685 [Clostridia bacterium]|nr:hypothetical protein [Clostridia bacterium]
MRNDEMNNSTLLKVLAFTAEKTLQLATANSILGEPIVSEGMTIVPISKVSIGFAGGGADVADAGKKTRQNPAGAGAKVDKTPMNFLVIRGNEVQVIGVDAPEKPAAMVGIINTVVDKAKELMSSKAENAIEE